MEVCWLGGGVLDRAGWRCVEQDWVEVCRTGLSVSVSLSLPVFLSIFFSSLFSLCKSVYTPYLLLFCTLFICSFTLSFSLSLSPWHVLLSYRLSILDVLVYYVF